MEITTTMVRFRCPKAMMDVKTPKAQMFSFGEQQNQKVWIPENKIIVSPSSESEDLNECVMPKWCMAKQCSRCTRRWMRSFCTWKTWRLSNYRNKFNVTTK